MQNILDLNIDDIVNNVIISDIGCVGIIAPCSKILLEFYICWYWVYYPLLQIQNYREYIIKQIQGQTEMI